MQKPTDNLAKLKPYTVFQIPKFYGNLGKNWKVFHMQICMIT
jgi:hypothetical protein